MIVTRRPISDGKDELLESVLVEPRTMTLEQAEATGFKQFACKIADKFVQRGQMATAEPVYFYFNAPTYEAAFQYARDHKEAELSELRKQANKERALNALRIPPTNGELNRLKLTDH